MCIYLSVYVYVRVYICMYIYAYPYICTNVMFSFMKNSLKKILVNTRIDVKYKNKQNLCEIKAFERNARKTLLFINTKIIVFSSF